MIDSEFNETRYSSSCFNFSEVYYATHRTIVEVYEISTTILVHNRRGIIVTNWTFEKPTRNVCRLWIRPKNQKITNSLCDKNIWINCGLVQRETNHSINVINGIQVCSLSHRSIIHVWSEASIAGVFSRCQWCNSIIWRHSTSSSSSTRIVQDKTFRRKTTLRARSS